MKRKVLLVEHHDSLRYFLGSFLSKQFDVIGSKNGLEAMSWLAKGVLPDVIVADAVMSEISNTQFLSNLRCSGMYADIPVVIIGSMEYEEKFRNAQPGVRDFIRKPFNPLQLQDVLLQITTQPFPYSRLQN